MLKKILLPTVVISGTLLAGFGALLVTQGNKPVQIQLENRPVFDGQFKDILSPQIGALLTIGVTLTTASLLAWRASAEESSQLEKRISQLKTEISYKDAQISELKVAPSSPMLSSLNWFLEGERVISSVTEPTVKQAVEQIPISEPVVAVRPATKPLVTPISSMKYEVITTTQPSVQTATSAFPTVQSVQGYVQRNVEVSVK
jgi:hypothetical protein